MKDKNKTEAIELKELDWGQRVFRINIFNYTLELKRWKR